MLNPKISLRKYAAMIVAARKAGGNMEQSHLSARLEAVIKLRTKPVKKPATR